MLGSEGDTPGGWSFPHPEQGVGLNHDYGGAQAEPIVETERGLRPCSTSIAAGAVLL
jgi:hypothetical protein